MSQSNKQKKIIDVVAAVIWDEPRFLVVDRPPGAIMAGYWEFPGGKVEPGEALDNALVRELEEELGVTATGFEHWCNKEHVYDHGHVRLYFYHVREFNGVPTGREGQNLAWVTPGQKCDLQFLPADIDLLEELGAVVLKTGS